MYRRTAFKASLLAFCKNDESLAAVRSYRWLPSTAFVERRRWQVPLYLKQAMRANNRGWIAVILQRSGSLAL